MNLIIVLFSILAIVVVTILVVQVVIKPMGSSTHPDHPKPHPPKPHPPKPLPPPAPTTCSNSKLLFPDCNTCIDSNMFPTECNDPILLCKNGDYQPDNNTCICKDGFEGEICDTNITGCGTGFKTTNKKINWIKGIIKMIAESPVGVAGIKLAINFGGAQVGIDQKTIDAINSATTKDGIKAIFDNLLKTEGAVECAGHGKCIRGPDGEVMCRCASLYTGDVCDGCADTSKYYPKCK